MRGTKLYLLLYDSTTRKEGQEMGVIETHYLALLRSV